MFSISKILVRVLVVEFYTQNLGLFLFIFFVMFGMVEGSQLVNYHLSLITGIIQSTAFLIAVLCVWVIYGIKSLQFISSQITKPQNAFLYVLGSLPRSSQQLLLFFIHLFVHAPVLLYVTAIAGVAFHLNKWLIGFEVIVFNLLLCFALSLFSWQKINNPISLKYSKVLKSPKFLRKHLAWFYGAFLFNDLKIMIAVTKLFSYFLSSSNKCNTRG
jgi:hypothetical protein